MWGRSPWGGWGANPLPSRFDRLWAQTNGSVTGGMPYSEGIYEDMNAALAWRHYWSGSADSTANTTLREYIGYEFSPVAEHIDAVIEAVGILELTWTTERHSVDLTTRAYALLTNVDAAMTQQARAAWRWRMLLLRARIDATLAANGGAMSGSVLCQAFAELQAIQHVNASKACGVPQVPCSAPSPTPPAPPTPPPKSTCPNRPFPGGFVPWVRVVNASNVYNEAGKGGNVTYLGSFHDEAGCKAVCEALSNCTQYEWSGFVAGSQKYSPWNYMCFGRCDSVWNLVPTPHGGVPGVSARRVNPSAHMFWPQR